MEEAHSSGTLVTIYLSTRFHYQDYVTIQENCCEKVKSCKTNKYIQNTKIMMTMFKIITVEVNI